MIQERIERSNKSRWRWKDAHTSLQCGLMQLNNPNKNRRRSYKVVFQKNLVGRHQEQPTTKHKIIAYLDDRTQVAALPRNLGPIILPTNKGILCPISERIKCRHGPGLFNRIARGSHPTANTSNSRIKGQWYTNFHEQTGC